MRVNKTEAPKNPIIDPNSVFYKLLQLAKDPSNVSGLINSQEQMVQANIAEALLESGTSASVLADIIDFRVCLGDSKTIHTNP